MEKRLVKLHCSLPLVSPSFAFFFFSLRASSITWKNEQFDANYSLPPLSWFTNVILRFFWRVPTFHSIFSLTLVSFYSAIFKAALKSMGSKRVMERVSSSNVAVKTTRSKISVGRKKRIIVSFFERKKKKLQFLFSKNCKDSNASGKHWFWWLKLSLFNDLVRFPCCTTLSKILEFLEFLSFDSNVQGLMKTPKITLL